jgi:hypothetical protein
MRGRNVGYRASMDWLALRGLTVQVSLFGGITFDGPALPEG